jgi:hypothetical protein
MKLLVMQFFSISLIIRIAFKKARTLRVCLCSATSILMKERTGIEIDLDPNPCV